MQLPHLPTLPKHFKATRTVLLVAAAVCLVVGITAIGVARQHTIDAASQSKAAAIQATQSSQARQLQVLQAQVSALLADKAKLEGNVSASCSYLTAISTAKATRGLVIVPTASGCTK